MVDIINLPEGAQFECNLADLPSALAEKIILHLPKAEEPHYCLVSRFYLGVHVYVVTRYRVVDSMVYIRQGMMEFEQKGDNYSKSILLSEIIGIEHFEATGEKKKQYYVLTLHSHLRDDFSLSFNNKEFFLKFVGAIVSFANKEKK